jgi:hypothetical protein
MVLQGASGRLADPLAYGIGNPLAQRVAHALAHEPRNLLDIQTVTGSGRGRLSERAAKRFADPLAHRVVDALSDCIAHSFAHGISDPFYVDACAGPSVAQSFSHAIANLAGDPIAQWLAEGLANGVPYELDVEARAREGWATSIGIAKVMRERAPDRIAQALAQSATQPIRNALCGSVPYTRHKAVEVDAPIANHLPLETRTDRFSDALAHRLAERRRAKVSSADW